MVLYYSVVFSITVETNFLVIGDSKTVTAWVFRPAYSNENTEEKNNISSLSQGHPPSCCLPET